MPRTTILLVLVFVAQLAVLKAVVASPTNAAKLSQPSSINCTGTYETKSTSSTHGYPKKEVVMQPTFLAQKLGNGRLKILVINQSGGIHNDHCAMLETTVKLHNGKATYKKGTYSLNILFRPASVLLTESGDPTDAEFGASSSVAGVYLLKSTKPPNFKKFEKDWGVEETEEED